MSPRRTVALVGLLLMPLLAACTSPHRHAAVKASPSPSPTPLSRAQLVQIANQAILTDTTLAGAPRQDIESTLDSPVQGCGKHLASERYLFYTQIGSWSGDQYMIDQQTYAYQGAAGRDVVAQAEALYRSCRHYTYHEFETSTEVITGSFTMPDLPGLDAMYTYCDRSTTTKPAYDVSTTCVVLMARGPIVESLRAQTDDTSYASRTPLRRIGPEAAARLVAAVPAGAS